MKNKNWRERNSTEWNGLLSHVKQFPSGQCGEHWIFSTILWPTWEMTKEKRVSLLFH
jgi:hypothetical protein